MRTTDAISKLPRSTCELCGLEATTLIVKDGKCINPTACARRQVRAQNLKDETSVRAEAAKEELTRSTE